jgi:quercetin dioxygenase-like cupin family protein
MHYTRLYTDPHGESRFEEVTMELREMGPVGYLSHSFPVTELQFRLNEAGYDWDFHNAPARQFIILLDGEIEITTSLGETRIFRGGDVLLAEDTHGKGHKTRNIKQQIRKSVFVRL